MADNKSRQPPFGNLFLVAVGYSDIRSRANPPPFDQSSALDAIMAPNLCQCSHNSRQTVSATIENKPITSEEGNCRTLYWIILFRKKKSLSTRKMFAPKSHHLSLSLHVYIVTMCRMCLSWIGRHSIEKLEFYCRGASLFYSHLIHRQTSTPLDDWGVQERWVISGPLIDRCLNGVLDILLIFFLCLLFFFFMGV